MKKSAIAFIHGGYWLAYFSLCAIAMTAISQFEGITEADLDFYCGVIFGIAVIPGIFSFYVYYFVLFPHFLKHKNLFQTIIIGLIFSFLTFFLAAATLRYTANMGWSCYGESNYLAILVVTFVSIVNGIIAFVIRGFITWYEELKLKDELRDKNHKMELALVKSQLDPHFLFNTLNNIDILILKDADMASSYLNKLSDIMRFMLFETKAEKIPLRQEIAYIEKFVKLQKIRTNNKAYVNFEVIGDVRDKKIAPLVFIPFIENAFKHTNNKKLDDAINILITVEDDVITMDCKNKLDPSRAKEATSHGLGQELITKRLRLLYPDLHTLEILRHENLFHVSLKILYEKV
jgi:sensor histidine kinase YesM